jgi:hypothetical protein
LHWQLFAGALHGLPHSVSMALPQAEAQPPKLDETQAQLPLTQSQ